MKPAGHEAAPARRRSAERGFTLIELMVVVTIIGVLSSIALPSFKIAIQQSREAVLREDLFQLRSLIDQYYSDKGKFPASLEALVEDGYLRAVPQDPITRQADWTTVEAEAEGDSGDTGIDDVHSASTETSLSGTPYSEW